MKKAFVLIFMALNLLYASDVNILEGLFGTHLLDPGGKQIAVSSLKDKKIAIYFSAKWCPPCRAFTPELVKFYNKLKKDKKPFELVFVSSDRDEKQMSDYIKSYKMPWLTVSYSSNFRQKLQKQFGVSGIPYLVIINSSGKILSNTGRSDVSSRGIKAFDEW